MKTLKSILHSNIYSWNPLLESDYRKAKDHLGPLSPLMGLWEGDKGDDIAPSDDRATENNKFREKMHFHPIGAVDNHEQKLYGLRYSKMAWRLNEKTPFHEEVGYYLWEPQTNSIIRSFLIPRGVSVLAGGTWSGQIKSKNPDYEFSLTAKVDSHTYGICSNLFLDKEFKTEKFESKIKFSENSLTYLDTTYIKINGQSELFLHIDQNKLVKVNT